jgi:hypothetical protein
MNLLIRCALRRPVTFVIAIALMGFISAAVSAATPSRNLSVNKTMKQIGETMTELFPIILNETKFQKPDNEDKINKDVDKIVQLIQSAEPHFKRRSKTNQISYTVLVEHLTDARKAMTRGNTRYAQHILKDTVTVCTACHTQDRQQRTLFSGAKRNAFSNDFEYAEFNFLTRNYDLALQYYDRYITSQASLKPEAMLLSSARKILTIYTQIYNRPGDAVGQFEKYLQGERLTPFVKASVSEWIKGLKQLEANNATEVKDLTFSELEKYVHRYLGPLDNPGAAVVPTKKERVYHVWLQGLLYRYLFDDPPEEVMPKLLYWLAINDRATSYSFYYSLADLYLKECMLNHTSHYYAKKCFEEYNEYVVFSFSGSAGTDIPEDRQAELDRFRDIVYGRKSD